jgi:glucosamine 6-phosphate synthetase-like amidotransferase/phosphosugar isomerase protein
LDSVNDAPATETVAVTKGADIDQPRNLAKSVTVE